MTRSATNKLGVKTVLIAPYNLELVAVEIFFNQIKNKMRASLRDDDTNFDKKEGIMTLFSSISSLNAIQISGAWIVWISKAWDWVWNYSFSKTIICKFWIFDNKIAKKIVLIIIKFFNFVNIICMILSI